MKTQQLTEKIVEVARPLLVEAKLGGFQEFQKGVLYLLRRNLLANNLGGRLFDRKAESRHNK